VWISPFYRSPMADFGYDVSDHRDVDPVFGTLEDFDALAAEARRLGLRLILDYIPNHTSDRHPWFRDPARRDWYLWRDEPTNWRSVFGGSAWTRDPASGRFYYHAYLAEQPDLNWRHPAVREAMLDVLRFWIARGADGFRIDALRQLVKDDRFRDNPPNPAWREGDDDYGRVIPRYTTDRPEVAEQVARFRAAVGDERLLIGELYLPFERLVTYYAAGLDMPANFHLLSAAWTAEAIGALVDAYEAALPDGAWPNWVLGNHDRPRLASRVGPEQARVAAMLLLTLRGTPTLYYGDELGLRDVDVDVPRDPWRRRDPARSPMPWDGGPNAGFAPAGAEPWLPLGDGASVADQRADPRSLLALHRALLALRRTEPALWGGGHETVAAGDGVLAYRRGRTHLVVLNLAAERREHPAAGRVALSTGLDRDGEAVAGMLALRGGEGVVLRIAEP